MGFLEDFREEKAENKQEMELETYVKKIVEDTIQSLNKELNTTLTVSKNKIAELTLELAEIQKLKQEISKYGENSQVISEKMLKNSEIFKEEFLQKLTEVKNTNEIFEKTLKESKFQENLERSFQKYLSSYEEASEKALTEISKKSYYAISEQEKRLNMRDNLLIFTNFIFAVILILVYFNYRNIEKENQRTQRDVQLIKESLLEDKKYWFDSKNKQLYHEYVEEIKRLKKQSNKKTKKNQKSILRHFLAS